MRLWQDSTPREYVLRLYRFLNQCGYQSSASMLRLSAKQSSARPIRKPAGSSQTLRPRFSRLGTDRPERHHHVASPNCTGLLDDLSFLILPDDLFE
jgi:hypothetical protein